MMPKRHTVAGAFAAALLPNFVQSFTRISRYETSVRVQSRLLGAKITAELVNDRDCALTDGFSLQLPLNARVTSLTVDASNNCQMSGEVKTVIDAQEAFKEQSSAGKAAALLQAWDATTYPVRVSLPPNGKTTVTIEYEELLARRNFEIPFNIPVSPGLPVDLLVMDIEIYEPDTGVASFDVELEGGMLSYGSVDGEEDNSTVRRGISAHLELDNVGKDDIPRLVKAKYDYDPLMMPTGGIVVGSGKCISHIFNPSALLSDMTLPKNLFFVIDVSGSMEGQKLEDAKRAFQAIIPTLKEDDYFTIHTFSHLGTEESWGPSKATSSAKDDASTFVLGLETIGGTNLEEAFVDAIARATAVQKMSKEEGHDLVPTIIVLSDGQASEGETDPANIARNVKVANSDIRAKIFALAFGYGADMPLLLGIALQNGGKAVPIYEGYGDSDLQMENFYRTELNDILLQELSFDIAYDVPIQSQTQTNFPVFADGSEIAIRAQPTSEEYFSGMVQVAANAISSDGPREWIYETEIADLPSLTPAYDRECIQSFAHMKISEVLDFVEAWTAIGSELDSYADAILGGDFDSAGEKSSDLAEDAKQYAIDLALSAKLIWPGLTAMVTIENEECATIFAEDNPVCEKGGGSSGLGGDEGGSLEEADIATTAGSPRFSNAPNHMSPGLLSFAASAMILMISLK